MGGVRHPLKQGPRAVVKSTCSRCTVASVSTNLSDLDVIDLRWSATGDGRKQRDPSPATPTAGSPHARYPPGLGSGSRTPTGRSNTTRPPATPRPAAKSSLRVRGGFRHLVPRGVPRNRVVSIRFEVRGGFRPELGIEPGRCAVSIRFKVRGGFRPYPLGMLPWQALLRCSYTPLLLTSSNKRTETVLNGAKLLVECHTHLRLFWVVLQHPCPRVSPKPLRQPGPPAASNSTLMPPPGPPCQVSVDPAAFFTSLRSAAPGPVGGPGLGSGHPPSRLRTVSRSTASPCSRR